MKKKINLKLSNVLINLDEYYTRFSKFNNQEFYPYDLYNDNERIEYIYDSGARKLLYDIIFGIIDNPYLLDIFNYSGETRYELYYTLSNRYTENYLDNIYKLIDEMVIKNGYDKSMYKHYSNKNSMFVTDRRYFKVKDEYTNKLVENIKYSLINLGIEIEDNFMKNLKFLSMGSNGYAYEIIGTNRILKITTNKDEYLAADNLIAQQSTEDNMLRLFPLYYISIYSELSGPTISNFDGSTKEKMLYYIVLDKLNEFTDNEKDIINDVIDYFYELISLKTSKNLFHDAFDKKFDNDNSKGRTKAKYIDTQFIDKNKYLKLVDFVLEIKQVMIDNNWTDLHAENIMYDNDGNIKAIDLQTNN